MSEIVIKAENLGKKYTIGHQTEKGGYIALRDVLMQSASGLWRKTKDLIQGKPIVQGDTVEEVWALKDVTFEIRRGEVVGIIGRNGAGKSTLLKVLSRITEPSAGRVTIKGRVASLLEVGTGFHPELTGRENIFLNGAIMGMARQEIKNKFDEIVAFAEVEKFLDTPVKRYSSGMYVRLAFAVAAHLEPEILLVDEVLAVGDAQFQKKCLGKMGEVAHEGRTVLFVSHNMGAVADLCSKAFLITGGKVSQSGSAKEIIRAYLDSGPLANRVDLLSYPHRLGDVKTIFTYIEIRNSMGDVSSVFSQDEGIVVRMGIKGNIGERIVLGIGIRNILGFQLLHYNTVDDKTELFLREEETIFELEFRNILNGGKYFLTGWIGDRAMVTQDYVRDCLKFSVDNSSMGMLFAKGGVIQSGYWQMVNGSGKADSDEKIA